MVKGQSEDVAGKESVVRRCGKGLVRGYSTESVGCVVKGQSGVYRRVICTTTSPRPSLMPAKEAGLSPMKADTLQSEFTPYLSTK